MIIVLVSSKVDNSHKKISNCKNVQIMLLLLFYICNHFMIFKNEHSPYPKVSMKCLVSCCWAVLFTSVDNVTFISAERPNINVVAQDIVIGDGNTISKGQTSSKEVRTRSCPADTNGKASSIMRRKQDFTSQVEFVAICLHLALLSKWKYNINK